MPTKIKKSQTRHRNNHRLGRRIIRHLQPLQMLAMGMIILGGLAGAVVYRASPLGVLAYATNINHAGLLVSTNQQRTTNGLSALAMNGQLNNAAQAKANDMVEKDYWAHASPDGKQPWDFIVAAGYSYSKAGENLAYGALTSEQTVQAWMNSPGHRANILKPDFTEVGFGFANSANYQGSGPQTVVVAMYAAPYGAPASPPPAPPAPQPAPAPVAPVQSSAAPSASPAPAAEPVSADEPHDEETPNEDEESIAPVAQIDEDGTSSVAPVEQAQAVRRVAVVTGNYTPWAVAIVALAGVVALGTFLYRHSKAWHRWIIRGEDFIIHHPVVDAAAVMILVTVVVLLQSVGHVL